MNCNECQRWMHAYLDDELDLVTSTHVVSHLAHCPECKQRCEEMRMLMSAIKEQAPYRIAPEALVNQVRAGLRPPLSIICRLEMLQKALPIWLAPAFSTVALALALLLYVATPPGANGNEWMDEAVSNHVRSLMYNHLADVASTDKHTVKPWFTGKLDYSPPVYNFPQQGYPLLGGRLEYMQHQPVAALAYRHNKHIINLFIIPTKEDSSNLQSLSEKGYNLVSWQQNHMHFIAVSDLNKAELEQFSALVQKGL